MARSTVITDASWCPNTRAGGWAAWININYEDGQHRRIKQSGRFNSLPRSSEHAEQLACMNGLFLAYSYGARDILIQTDCLSLVQTYGRGSNQKRTKNFIEGRDRYWPEANVRWKHVKGHNLGNVNDRRTFVNEWCDREAKVHMRKQRKEIHNGQGTVRKGAGRVQSKGSG